MGKCLRGKNGGNQGYGEGSAKGKRKGNGNSQFYGKCYHCEGVAHSPKRCPSRAGAPSQEKACIERPRQDPKSGYGRFMGKLKKAMSGARDAPQIWGGTVTEQFVGVKVTAMGGGICHRSTTQADVAPSSGEAELK